MTAPKARAKIALQLEFSSPDGQAECWQVNQLADDITKGFTIFGDGVLLGIANWHPDRLRVEPVPGFALGVPEELLRVFHTLIGMTASVVRDVAVTP